MTVANLFAKHRAGEVSKEKFLYEVRRDAQLPYISNLTSYDDAIKMLKQKGVIKEASFKVDKSYTHFAIGKADNKIVTGWDYKGVDNDEIKGWAKGDLKDMDLKPSNYAVVSATALKKRGIDPFSWDNWKKDVNENSDYEEEDDDDTDDFETDYLEFTDGDTTVSMYKDGGKWIEGEVIEGDRPYGWGSKKYMSYLTPRDIASYLSKDYGGTWTSYEGMEEAGIQKDINGTPLDASIAQIMGPNDPLAKIPVDDWTEDDHKRFWHIMNMVKTTGKAPGPLSGQSRFPVDESILNEQEDLYHQIDRLNPILVKKAVNMELAKLPMIDAAIYQNITEKVVKKLQKDPRAYDEVLVSNAKEIHKVDEKLKMQQVKGDNLKDKANEMKTPKGVEKKPKANVKASKKENKKGKPAGVKLMEAIKDILKKKLTEDVHHEYGVGQSIDVPEGHGTIKGMVGDTVTLEFEDGSQKDYQINALNHFREEAKKPKEEMTPEVKKHEPTMDEKKDAVIKRVMELLTKKKKIKGEAITAKGRDTRKNAATRNKISKNITNPNAKNAMLAAFDSGEAVDAP
jgi:hypothetical protein